ncbi:lamin tail domain-containing protein [Verrucomicrobiaceae bacterium 227]
MPFKLPSKIALAITLSTAASHADIVINEVHYDADPKTDWVEFIELINSGATSVDLGLWSFSDGLSFTFPGGTMIAPGEILLVAESPAALSNRFTEIPGSVQILTYAGSLSSSGETLTLVDSTGAVIDTVDYQTEFPWPIAASGEGDSMQLLNPELDNNLGGAWRSSAPTPGLSNTPFTTNAPPLIRQVGHSPKAPTASDDITISAKISDTDGVASVTLLYQIVAPGSFIPAYLPNSYGTLTGNPNAPQSPNPDFENAANWTTVTMTHNGDGIFTAQIPAQNHRSLVRYRIVADDSSGASVRVPYADDPSLNFACFVYNGVPDYVAGTTTFDSEMLTALPVYTMITRDEDREFAYAYNPGQQIPKSNAARGTYNWECALVYDGVVYDHVGWRLRQNNDRYAGSGKRSMRYRMNRGHYFQAHDENGNELPVKWRRFNTSKMSRFGGTNSYGLHETVNSKLWRMVGVECPYFLPAHFRMIDGADEAPDQYNGDFFGFATIVQDIDGRLLDERDLPDGNIYKLKDGVSNPLELQRNQTRTGVSDASDFTNIKNKLNQTQDSAWLNEHVDWNQWARYHAVVEAVRHYDFGTPSTHFKNRAWYFKEDPGSPLGQLRIIPHDHDASWLKGYHDSLNNVGNSIGTGFPWAAIFNGNTRPPGSEKTEFARDYRNFVREFRQLLWQPETVNSLIDDHVALLEPFTLADQARWSNGPASAGRESMIPIENVASPMKDLAFVSDTIYGTNLPGGRGAFLDQISDDPAIPNQPTITYSGTAGFPSGGLQFTSSAFADPQGPGTFGKMQWRLAEVSGLGADGEPVSLAGSGDLWKYFDTGTDPGTSWTQPNYDDSAWGEGASELGYGEDDEATTVTGGHTTTYFRRVINIVSPDLYRIFSAGVVRDDGVIIYVNGQEVWRDQMPEGAVDFTTPASGSASGSNEREFQPFTIPANLLVPGENLIAVEIHQRTPTSGDMSFDFQLTATPAIGERNYEWSDSWESGEITNFGANIVPPAVATRSGSSYRARVRHADATGNWGLWSEPLEFTASTPDISLLADNLIISEIMYHPANPSAAELAAGFDDDDFFEFIELRNIGTQVLDLSDVRFTKGIDFDFSGALSPGESLIVVNNVAAFEMRYGPGLPLAGAWEGKLNNAGEQLKLSFGAGEAISDFEYDDATPWPTTPDGAGASLTRILSATTNDPSLPTSWRSGTTGGSPGTSDVQRVAGDPQADEDGDELDALLELAFGTSDHTPTLDSEVFSLTKTSDGLLLQLQRNLAAEEIEITIESSPDLATWTATGLGQAIEQTDLGNSLNLSSYHLDNTTARHFWRVRVISLTQ